MKAPFRIINASEWEQLNIHVATIIEVWNETYAMIPIAFKLEKPYDLNLLPHGFLVFCEANTIAWIESHCISVFQQSLFGNTLKSFATPSQELLSVLLASLFKTDHCTIKDLKEPRPSWLYKGSTALVLNITVAEHHVRLILSPEWVLQQLIPASKITQPLIAIESVLSEEVMQASIELDLFSLALEQLLTLESGDVLVSNHPLHAPLTIMHQNKPIATASLGQSSHQKSILLTRSI